MVAGVEKYRQEKQADVVVYGHTHDPGQIGDHHFNAGSWARTHDTYVRIEDDGTTNVWEWVGTWAETVQYEAGGPGTPAAVQRLRRACGGRVL